MCTYTISKAKYKHKPSSCTLTSLSLRVETDGLPGVVRSVGLKESFLYELESGGVGNFSHAQSSSSSHRTTISLRPPAHTLGPPTCMFVALEVIQEVLHDGLHQVGQVVHLPGPTHRKYIHMQCRQLHNYNKVLYVGK